MRHITETKMEKELNEKYYGFHDGIILKKSIDFENKKTEIIIEDFDFLESKKKYKLEFQSVELQNFEHYNLYNGIFKISCYKSYKVFRYEQEEYLTKFEKYFTEGTLEKIEKNIRLKFFYIISTTNGLEGFIVCESLNITEIK